MSGQVTLVGAGCGRGLITQLGLAALKKAESVVYDDLIDPQLLDEVPLDCRRIYVGKRSGQHSKKQEEINEILIEEAKAGYRVVRLKGGDSFVFGRGGEEILALEEAGIAHAVIPGVTSSVAVPESLGIPVTHRGEARAFTVITGHTKDEDAEEEKKRFESLSGVEGTLIFLMGLNAAPKIAAGLLAAGKPADTPAAIVYHGYAKDAGRIDGTLGELPEMAKQGKTPAIIVVGQTAGYHMEDTLPLLLKRQSVTVCGTKTFTLKLKDVLEENGAWVERVPLLDIEPVPEEIPDEYENGTWLVFTSSNGIHLFFRTLKERKTDLRVLGNVMFACIGKGTAQTLQEYGYTADFIPNRFTAADLGKELAEHLQADKAEPAKAVILRAANGSPELTKALDAAKISYKDHKIYRAKIDAGRIPKEAIETDWIIFASAYGAKGFFEGGGAVGRAKIICIGDITAEEAKKHISTEAAEQMLIAKEHSAEGILQLLLKEGQDS